MDDAEYLLTLEDRIGVIRAVNEKYGLEGNAYLSFSGGKDSTALSRLLDMALPGNRIPRVFIDTGIEYLDVKAFVASLMEKDDRFVAIKPSAPVKQVLERYGYPFKSKEHSCELRSYQNGLKRGVEGYRTSAAHYLGLENSRKMVKCPKSLKYQFSPDFKLKVSDQCCQKMKKDSAKRYEKESGRRIAITGMMRSEGGERKGIGCVLTDGKGRLKRFHPLAKVAQEWEDEFIKREGIVLCRLYYPPFGFARTGCKGCPFAIDLQGQLATMALYMPAERAQCEAIWKPVYEEYRRIGFRLKKEEQGKLF